MAQNDDIVMLCINIASAILSFVAVLSIVTKNFEAGIAVGVLVMISQLITAVKSFMESSSTIRAQQDTNRILNEILTEMRGMQDMMHGQYHSSNIQPGTLTSNAQSTGFDLPSEVRKDVVSHPNETEAIVRDLIDDMLTAVIDGTPLVQTTPSWTERKSVQETVRRHRQRDHAIRRRRSSSFGRPSRSEGRE